MIKKCLSVACFLQVLGGGCLDYVFLGEEKMQVDKTSFPPIIDMTHISPHPTRLLNSISVGKNCKGQKFQVPPIYDRNKNDRLHYLWFFDNKLINQATIEPEFRHTGIISLNIDPQFLMSHFDSQKPKKDFFDRYHLIEFFVSDLPYKIPESRYIDENAENEKYHGDYCYWIVYFNDVTC